MREEVADFLNASAIAVVGVSSKKTKFGSVAYRALKSKNYRVFAVNPNLESIDGDICYRSLADLPGDVEAALVTVKPASADGLVEQARKAGIKKLWFQQGADFTALARQARAEGLAVVENRCILMYAEPVAGIHRVHRFFAKLFKRY